MRRTKYCTIEFDIYIDDPDGMDLSSDDDNKMMDVTDAYADAVCNGLRNKLKVTFPELNPDVKYHY